MVGPLRVTARVLRAKRLVAAFIVGTWQPWRPQGNGCLIENISCFKYLDNHKSSVV